MSRNAARSQELSNYPVVALWERLAWTKVDHGSWSDTSECSADVERGTFLERGMRRCQNLESHVCQGGTLGMHSQHGVIRHVPRSCDALPGKTARPEKGEVEHPERVAHLDVHLGEGGMLGTQR
jgi:hypothetical protein